MNLKIRSISAVAVLGLLAGSACGGDASGTEAPRGTKLIGVFAADAGKCSGKKPSGSYMRMIQPEADLEEGPFVENGDSPCKDKSFTPFIPGTDGGLSTADFQPTPKKAFDAEGNAIADAIMKPQGFYGVNYSISTNPVDPQTEDEIEVPAIYVDGAGNLSGDVRGWVVAWNGQYFNQGAPKPDGSTPGFTTPPTGTYDADSGRFELDWTSLVNGGPFDGFTGIWHLEGTFRES